MEPGVLVVDVPTVLGEVSVRWARGQFLWEGRPFPDL